MRAEDDQIVVSGSSFVDDGVPRHAHFRAGRAYGNATLASFLAESVELFVGIPPNQVVERRLTRYRADQAGGARREARCLPDVEYIERSAEGPRQIRGVVESHTRRLGEVDRNEYSTD